VLIRLNLAEHNLTSSPWFAPEKASQEGPFGCE